VSEKRIIIIGGGMAGLCAGCYLRMNGYDTVIYEMNSSPGGGLPPALTSGRNAAQVICRRDKRKFTVTSGTEKR
jgi:flavin-dependent dehydrogenase